MTILAIDTSSTWCSVALLLNDVRYLIKHQELGSHASSFLLPWVDELCHLAQIDLTSIKAVAVSQGPGAFTGVRLGVGVAQGLALALNKPLLPIPSLDGIAMLKYKKQDFTDACLQKMMIALDARMGQVFWASYEVTSSHPPRRLTQIHVNSPEDLDMSEVDLCIGNGFEIYADRIQFKAGYSLTVSANSVPHALGIAYAATYYQNFDAYQPELCQPLYIRDKVALTTAERLASKKNWLRV